MLPASRDIDIYQGDTFTLHFRLRLSTAVNNPEYVDLTNSVLKAQVRSVETSTTVLAEMICTVFNQTSYPGEGEIKIPSSVTATMSQSGVWDLQATFGDGTVITYMRGAANFVREVTR